MRIANLSELDSRYVEVGPDTESSESENEGSCKKSGVHGGYTFGTLRRKEGGGKG